MEKLAFRRRSGSVVATAAVCVVLSRLEALALKKGCVYVGCGGWRRKRRREMKSVYEETYKMIMVTHA